MSKIFKPRRGKYSTMHGTKSSTVLAAGEMFIELPDTGAGTGACKMYIGDGLRPYSELQPAMGGDIASREITGSITADQSSTAEAAIANVTTQKTLGAILGSLRRACQLNAASIKTLNDETRTVKDLLDNIKIRVYNTLGGDVLTVAKNLVGRNLIFYCNSNKPDNRPMSQPQECSWGPYIIYRQTNSNNFGVAIYIGDNFIAKAVFNDDTVSLNW